MREIDYTDAAGRRWRVQLPDGAPDSDAPDGVPVGPPDVVRELEARGLPGAVATRLHNELHRRKLFTMRDVRARPGDVQGALQAALRLDVQAIMEQYEVLEGMRG